MLLSPGWLIVLLMAPGFIILVGVVAFFVFGKSRKPGGGDRSTRAYYHVMGIDQKSGERRETTFEAANHKSALGRAELEGIIVTEIRRVAEPR